MHQQLLRDLATPPVLEPRITVQPPPVWDPLASPNGIRARLVGDGTRVEFVPADQQSLSPRARPLPSAGSPGRFPILRLSCDASGILSGEVIYAPCTTVEIDER